MNTDLYVVNVKEAVAYIQSKEKKFSPKVAITLGSGLGKLANLIVPVAEIAYADIPHFPTLTVPGHEGKLILGTLEGIPVVGLKGRKHYYEVADQPHAMDIVTFPVQVAASLGCSLYIATNAAGGLNPSFAVGDVMVLTSHVGLFLPNPLLGPHHDFGGNFLFQPQSGIYNKQLQNLFIEGSKDVKSGVYAAVTGRTYETKGECLLLRNLGIDAVGMSTVPEVIVAENRGMETFAASIITNAISPDGTNATNHEEVTAILNSPQTEERLLALFRSFFTKLHSYTFKK